MVMATVITNSVFEPTNYALYIIGSSNFLPLTKINRGERSNIPSWNQFYSLRSFSIDRETSVQNHLSFLDLILLPDFQLTTPLDLQTCIFNFQVRFSLPLYEDVTVKFVPVYVVKIYFHFQFLSRIHPHKFDSPQPLPFWVHVAMSGWCAPCARACLVADDDGCVLVSRALKKQKASCARLASLRRGCSRYACILPRRNIDRVLFRPQRRHSTFPSSLPSLQPLAPPFLLSLLAFHRRISFFFLPLPLIFSLSFFFFLVLLLLFPSPPSLLFLKPSPALFRPPQGGEPSLFATRTWFPHIKESYLLMRHNYPPFTMADGDTLSSRGGGERKQGEIRTGAVVNRRGRERRHPDDFLTIITRGSLLHYAGQLRG